MTESVSRRLDRRAALFFRLLKWAGLTLLLSFLILFLVGYFYSHRPSRPWIETRFPKISDWNSLEIILSRGPCLGECRVYKVAVDGLGNVVFDGDVPSVPPPAYGVAHRVYRSKISETSVHQLFTAFQKAQFFWLYDEYGMAAFDLPKYKISIAFDGRKKEVVDYGGTAVSIPKEVRDLEAMIDRVVGTSRWMTYDGERLRPEPPEPRLIIPEIPKVEPPKINVEKLEGLR